MSLEIRIRKTQFKILGHNKEKVLGELDIHMK